MEVRKFLEQDRATLREVYRASRQHAFDWLEERSFCLEDFDRDTEGEAIWVGLNADQAVGFISVWEPEDYIHNLFVHPRFLGQGIGSMLLKVALEKMGRPARLKCEELNARARRFYGERGWKAIDEGTGRYGKYLLMELADTDHIKPTHHPPGDGQAEGAAPFFGR